MTEPRTPTPADILEACDRANRKAGFTVYKPPHPRSELFTTLCEAVAELREFRAEVDRVARDLMRKHENGWIGNDAQEELLRSLMLPEPVDPLEALVDERMEAGGAVFSRNTLSDFARQAAAIGEARRG